MARKKPEPKPVPEVEAVKAQIEPVVSKKGRGKLAETVGRARIKLNPIKSWSGGLSEAEVAKWEAVASIVRSGTPATMAVGPLGMRASYQYHRSRKSGVYQMLMDAWDEGSIKSLDKIKQADSWQAAAWLLERCRPMDFAVDGSIRRTILELAQEAGLDVADINDLIRLVKSCAEKEIDLGAYVTEELSKRDREALEIAS